MYIYIYIYIRINVHFCETSNYVGIVSSAIGLDYASYHMPHVTAKIYTNVIVC